MADWVVLPGGALVYALTRLLRLPQRKSHFADARRSSLWILASLAGGMALAIVLSAGARGPSRPPATRPFGAEDVIAQAVAFLIAYGPAIAVMRLRGEPWASAGVTTEGLGRALLVGAVLALLPVAAALAGGPGLGGLSAIVSARGLWALLLFIVVAVSEEFAFRGCLQTRLVAWLGPWPGWAATAILFALVHACQPLLQGVPLSQALIQTAWLMPISLLLGYVMLRTESIAAPALLHTFVNWLEVLG